MDNTKSLAVDKNNCEKDHDNTITHGSSTATPRDRGCTYRDLLWNSLKDDSKWTQPLDLYGTKYTPISWKQKKQYNDSHT